MRAAPGGLRPEPDQAREWLARELREARYQESLAERFSRWFQELLDSLGDVAAGSGPIGLVAAVVLVVVLAAGIAFALSRLRRDGGRARASAPVFGSQRRTSAEHRAAAEAALAAGAWDEAVQESVRALSAGLVERDLLSETVGLTVLETTAVASARFPGHAERLQRLRVDFEESRYGGRPAGAEAARQAVDVERATSTATPGEARPAPSTAVPS